MAMASVKDKDASEFEKSLKSIDRILYYAERSSKEIGAKDVAKAIKAARGTLAERLGIVD